jgi:hypothetical protein
MRMMLERGDFKIFHEATVKPYSMKHNSNFSARKPDAPSTYADVKRVVFNALSSSNVFLKEMSYSMLDFVREDRAFVQDPRVQFVFLLRNPHHAAVSLFSKCLKLGSLYSLPESSYLLGYNTCYSIFQEVKQYGAHKPIIIFAEELCNAPAVVVKAFCTAVGIDFKPEALQWQDLGADFTGHTAWHESRQDTGRIHHWHGDAIHSTGMGGGLKKDYQLDAEGNPSFVEFANETDRTTVKAAYAKNVPYYNLFKAETAYFLPIS